MITGCRLTSHANHPRTRQSGSMTLLVGLILLVGAGILTFSAGRTGVVEQRIANNEFRAQEAQQAAQAGLDYALAWLAENIWRSGDAEPAPPEVTTSSGEIYRTALVFTKTAQGVCVRAQAHATTEQRITASVRECVQQRGLFDPAATSAMPPPLVLAGCLGAPDETANLFLPDDAARSVMSGHAANNVCLPQCLRVARPQRQSRQGRRRGGIGRDLSPRILWWLSRRPVRLEARLCDATGRRQSSGDSDRPSVR